VLGSDIRAEGRSGLRALANRPIADRPYVASARLPLSIVRHCSALGSRHFEDVSSSRIEDWRALGDGDRAALEGLLCEAGEITSRVLLPPMPNGSTYREYWPSRNDRTEAANLPARGTLIRHDLPCQSHGLSSARITCTSPARRYE
jgi:hypothetical protein